MPGKVDYHGMTHVGQRREVNEDQFLIAELNKSLRVHQTSLDLGNQSRLYGNSQGVLFVVADGLGGHRSGERASTVAVDSLITYAVNTMRWFFQLDEDCQDEFPDSLKQALQFCQSQVRSESAAFADRRGMGTTLTMAYVIWPRLYILHAGDSRCYVLRSGKLQQLTRDHSLAQQFVDEGLMSAADAEHSPWQNILWNVIGGDDAKLVPDVYRSELNYGDTLLLCTDGLTNHLAPDEITRQLGAEHSAEHICQQLVDRANQAGGSDNITVIVARFNETPSPPKPASAQEQIRPVPNPLADTDYDVTPPQVEDQFG